MDKLCVSANAATVGPTSVMPTSTTPAPVTTMNVAFFAQFTTVLSGGRIVFNNMTVNLGNGYNPGTGVFRSPQSGLYMFAFGISSHGNSVQTYLTKNGRAVGVSAITDPKGITVDDSSTSFAVLRLDRDDEISVNRYSAQDPNSGFFAGWKISPLDSMSVYILTLKYLFFTEKKSAMKNISICMCINLSLNLYKVWCCDVPVELYNECKFPGLNTRIVAVLQIIPMMILHCSET